MTVRFQPAWVGEDALLLSVNLRQTPRVTALMIVSLSPPADVPACPRDEVDVEVHVDFGILGRALENRRTLDAPQPFIDLLAPFASPY